MINVKDYAKGDGSTDDTTAIQTLINAAGASGGNLIYFPTGVYKVTSPLTIQSENVRMLGEHAATTRIKYTGGAATAVLDIGFPSPSTTNIDSISVENLTVQGNAQVVNAIRCNGVHRSNFANLRPRDCTGAAMLVRFGVNNTYYRIECSANTENFVVSPNVGFQIDKRNAGERSTSSTIIDPEMAGLTAANSVGLVIRNADNIVVTGGDAEFNSTGMVIGESIDPGGDCFSITLIGTDFESNSIEDVSIYAWDVNLVGVSTKRQLHIQSIARRVNLVGGLYFGIAVGVPCIKIDTGAKFTRIGNVRLGGTGLDDAGDNTTFELDSKLVLGPAGGINETVLNALTPTDILAGSTNTLGRILLGADGNAFVGRIAANTMLLRAGDTNGLFVLQLDSAAYPALKAVSPTLQVRAGDDSADAPVSAAKLTLSAAAPTVAAGQVGFGGTTAATATNGTGEAMKANVEGYLVVNVAGTTVKVPYVKN